MDYTNALQWRYAVKKFNGEKVSDDQLSKITNAINLSASSLGLQPYRILVIENQEVKENLMPAFHNQAQIPTCSHLILFVAKKEIEDAYITRYFDNISETRGATKEELAGFEGMVRGFVTGLPENIIEHWTGKQAYIGLGTGLLASSLEKVDSCPMEGFNHELAGEVLKLDAKNERIVVAMPIGFRAVEDGLQHAKKVRKPIHQFVEKI